MSREACTPDPRRRNAMRSCAIVRPMAYDESLAKRIEACLDAQGLPGWTGKRMFGGVCYMTGGNMACGVHRDKLIVRVGPDRYPEALKNPHAGVFDITGRPMKGWVSVSAGGFKTDKALQSWIDLGVAFALSLPPK